MATFGNQLRLLRERAGLSQIALAERANVSPDAVASLEQGRRSSPHPHTLAALAEALLLSAEERELLAASARSARSRVVARHLDVPRPPPTKALSNQTPLIGRAHDIQRLRELLAGTGGEPRPRLVTLTGVGGVGKTSLALAVATELRSVYVDGVWPVELAPVLDAAMLPRVVGAALGVPDLADASPEEALVTYLQTRRLLLVLDNCEHLIQACADLVGVLLAGCRHVQLLATSREPLLIPGEQQVRVQPLPVPEDADASSLELLTANPAVQLVLARAHAASMDLSLTADDTRAIARICTRLEGIPLALDLAAARLTVLTPWQLLERLDDAFQLLATPSRAAPSRQQTLRAALDWSYALLTAPEQAIFRRLGVFARGVELDAAEAVCPLEDLVAQDVLDLIGRLVDKSLVLVDVYAGIARYRLLEPLRQYAAQRLATCAETAPVERGHTAFYLGLAGEAAQKLSGPQQIAWLSRLDRECDNLRAALHRVAASDDVELELQSVTALRWYWETRGQLGEGRRWLEHAIARARACGAPSQLLRDALFGAGRLCQWQADLTASAALIEESLELSRALADQEAIAEGLAWLGTVYRRQGAHQEARRVLEESLTLGRSMGTSTAYASALTCMGVLLENQGDAVRARDLLEHGLTNFQALGDLRWQAIALVMLGRTALAQQEAARARAWLIEGLTLLRSIGDPVIAVTGIEALAEADVTAGQVTRAARWLGATEELRERLGAGRAVPNWRTWDRALTSVRAQLGDARLADELATGRGLGLDRILAEALESAGAASTPAESSRVDASVNLVRLTRRESEVVELLRLGHTDREIAARLSISTGTASLHVHRVLGKLNAHSRWQVAERLARVAESTSQTSPSHPTGGAPV